MAATAITNAVGYVGQAAATLGQSAGPIVTLEMFGAEGTNVSADQESLGASITFLNSVGGGTIRGQPGRTYYFHQAGGTYGIPITKPLRIDLNGASFRRPENLMTLDFQRMITLRPASADASLEVFGGELDANYTGNKPVVALDQTDFEHNATVFVWVAAAGVRFVKFRDLKLKDRWNFDHLAVYATNSNSVDLVTFDNVVSDTGHSPDLRADILWTEGCLNVRVQGCTVERIETEFDSAPTAPTIASIKNSTCREWLQLAGNGPTTASLVKMYLDRVVTRATDVSYVELHDRNTDFGRVSSWNPSVWHSQDSRFLVIDTGFPAHNLGSLVANHVNVDWHLGRPKFRLDSGPQTHTNPAFRFPIILDTYEDVSMVFEEPDWLDHFGLIGTPHGKVRIDQPKVRQLGAFAFAVSGNAGRVVDVTIDGGDYSQCAGTPIRLDSFNIPRHRLTLLGDWKDAEGRVSSSGTVHDPDCISNYRRIFAATEPPSSILGDELHIISPPMASIKIAVSTADSSAIWQAIGKD